MLLFVCSGVLLTAGLAGNMVGWRTLVPDMLGYAASVTYNSPYCLLSDPGGAVDALDRALVLCEVRFKFADVSAADDVRRITFT